MDELQKNDVVELTVDNLGCDGEGVAKCDGKTVFIKGALPGERIRAKIIAVRPRFDVALLEKVLSPSPERSVPPCPLFGKCGGCDLQHLAYSAQLEFKRKTVSDALKRIGGVDAEVDEVVPSAQTLYYRNKISLPVRRTKNGVEIGLFAKGSHRVVQTNDCLLQHSWTKPLIAAFRKFVDDSGLYGYDEERNFGDVRHLVARNYGGRLSVTVVSLKRMDCKPFARLVQKINPACEVYLNVNRRHDNVILGSEWQLVYTDGGETTVDGLKASVHPAGFFQVNDEIREKLYGRVAELCEGGFAVEAYSGAGLLSAMLAKKADEVYAIEINEQSHQSALKLKADNNICNFFPVQGDVGEKLPSVLKKANGRKSFIVLDPPRTGISPACAQTLISSSAQNLIYISCNPATLARDLATLTGAYSIRSVTPYDMFPQTANVETLVVLSHKNRTDISA